MASTMEQKLFYNTVLSQTFSPDGNYLMTGNIYGDVSVFDLPRALGPNKIEENELQGPTYRFAAHPDQQVACMLSTEDFFITGTCGEISGWDWKMVTSSKAPNSKISWNIQIPTNKDSYEKPDVNYMVYSKTNKLLYAGCGDNNIYIINLEDGRILRDMQGHTDYIHCLAIMGNQLASCSEDGSVRLWDLRKKENTNILTPHLIDKVARPRLGKWIGAVDFTEDWLLCGGGPSLSLWHMRTMEAATIFDLTDQGIHVAEIYEERVIAAGAASYIYHITYQGETLAKVPTSSNTVYSVVYQELPQKVLSAAGSSNYLDLCTNFNYREMVLKFA
ncbi:THO complex subunit 6 homolog isoform X2 [Harpegnathos saltator]|uniref:THO complex subunit 6-like protein n=1 Tax=Harpegnathos saltator TaxID=610380 RepID=E2BKD8_HARSA|nr:THO complex subunit 6 homolog isoform X2 [Harpegnathos saltator]XP_025156886.1 THO complex subunit 6 homolog isoform X2 [Harpegnathos saltator]EFN83862.1 THO complex subunit 6-like protein [Harpegnathos saltator]